MDTEIDVEVESSGLPVVLGAVRDLFEEQEERFSRFQPTSLTSRLNAGETVIDAVFAEVCGLAVDCWHTTGGLFNPLILAALEAAGYDRTFAGIGGGAPRAQVVPDPSQALVIDGDSVRLTGGRVDFGGMVKGWTVDRALRELTWDGTAGLVNAGGDLACFGGVDGGGWAVEVAGPGGDLIWGGEITGGLATSTTLRRRWSTSADGHAHHLIDPRSGLPAESPFVQVSARAASACEAEVWAKAVLIGGPEATELAIARGLSVLTVSSDGETTRWGKWPYFSRPER